MGSGHLLGWGYQESLSKGLFKPRPEKCWVCSEIKVVVLVGGNLWTKDKTDRNKEGEVSPQGSPTAEWRRGTKMCLEK